MLRRRALLLTPLALTSCGFALRQPVAMPYQRIALRGFAARSAMAEAVARALPAGTRVVDRPDQAQIMVVALEDRFVKTVVASTAAGQVREFRLRVLLRFHLAQPDGTPLTANDELEQLRDLGYTETQALGKQAEEDQLVREMRDDIARQLLQMLATVGRSVAP
jgi:LPS-assembly lipoprotein